LAGLQGEKMNLVVCGWRHTIAVSDSGKLYTFGWSKYGQLGHGDFEDHLVPFQVQALKNKTIQAVSSLAMCPFNLMLVVVGSASLYDIALFAYRWLIFATLFVVFFFFVVDLF
jgi:hypothetical protein